MTKEEIRDLRNKLQLTQERFAAKIGVTRGTVINWEKGANEPSPLALHMLLRWKEIVKYSLELGIECIPYN